MDPIINLEKRLANRTREYRVGVDRAVLMRRIDPVAIGRDCEHPHEASIGSYTRSRHPLT
jgi:hypothetical protein